MIKSRKKECDKICKYFYVDIYFHPVCDAPEDYRNECGQYDTETGLMGFGLDENDLQEFTMYRCEKLKYLCDETGHLPQDIGLKYRTQMEDDNMAAITSNFFDDNIKIHAKVSRNEPCPCGSGKKYKKCCGK